MGRLKLTGVSDPDAVVKTIWDTLHNRSKVSANILTEDDVKVEQADGLSYITVKVPRADRHIRPVYLNNDLDNGTYRRNSEGDYHCTIPEILEMGRDSSEVSDDSRAIENTGIEDINRDSLNAYRNYLLSNNPSHPWLRKPEEEFLRLIGAADIDKDRFRLTQAGLLMFGKEYRISRELPNYHLDYRYYLDSDEWNDRLDSGSGMWSGNVFDFYLEVSRRLSLNSNVPFALKEDRRVYDTVLMKAEREMVLN